VAQNISAARVKSCTKENVNQYFDLLELELKKINFNPNRLYSCDETGVNVVQHENTKMIAMKGKKAVASLNICRTWMPYHGGNIHECGESLCTTFGCVSSKEHAD
jgi:hypothetical protein